MNNQLLYLIHQSLIQYHYLIFIITIMSLLTSLLIKIFIVHHSITLYEDEYHFRAKINNISYYKK